MIYDVLLRRRQPRVLQQPQAMTAYLRSFSGLSQRSDRYRYGGHLLCHDLNRELPVLQAAREANPFISAHWAAIEPTRYVCKSPRAGMVQGGDSANSGTRRDIPKARDAHTLALSVLAEVASDVSIRRRIHTYPRRPDPCGRRGKRFLTSGGNTIN